MDQSTVLQSRELTLRMEVTCWELGENLGPSCLSHCLPPGWVACLGTRASTFQEGLGATGLKWTQRGDLSWARSELTLSVFHANTPPPFAVLPSMSLCLSFLLSFTPHLTLRSMRPGRWIFQAWAQTQASGKALRRALEVLQHPTQAAGGCGWGVGWGLSAPHLALGVAF